MTRCIEGSREVRYGTDGRRFESSELALAESSAQKSGRVDPAAHEGEPWTTDDLAHRRELAEGTTPTRVVRLKLGRSEDVVRATAQEEVRGKGFVRWRARFPAYARFVHPREQRLLS